MSCCMETLRHKEWWWWWWWCKVGDCFLVNSQVDITDVENEERMIILVGIVIQINYLHFTQFPPSFSFLFSILFHFPSTLQVAIDIPPVLPSVSIDYPPTHSKLSLCDLYCMGSTCNLRPEVVSPTNEHHLTLINDEKRLA